MTSGDSEPRFTPQPRRHALSRESTDLENLRDELMRIRGRTEAVVRSDRQAFTEGSATFDVASMAIIRLAALLERPEFAELAHLLSGEEVAAIRTTRNIASHAGYEGMNDDLFWAAVTIRVPAIIQRLLDGEAALGQ